MPATGTEYIYAVCHSQKKFRHAAQLPAPTKQQSTKESRRKKKRRKRKKDRKKKTKKKNDILPM